MTQPIYSLGKKKARFVESDKFFATYRNPTSAGTLDIPSVFGHGNTFTDWGMNGNDLWGDCVWAGGGHETELINNLADGGKVGVEPIVITADNSLSDYAASTGFNINAGPSGNNPTDQGTDVHDALNYRQTTGLVDSVGNRHKIAAYVALEVGNYQHLLEAAWIFDFVGIGINFPESAMTQFNNGQPWSVVPGATISGGHYIPIVGVPTPGMLAIVTWGKRQLMTEGFFKKYCDEAYAMITLDSLNSKTNENYGGFNWTQLQADLKIVS
jgi:hypothetical protein